MLRYDLLERRLGRSGLLGGLRLSLIKLQAPECGVVSNSSKLCRELLIDRMELSKSLL
jgi:hypothetical protein